MLERSREPRSPSSLAGDARLPASAVGRAAGGVDFAQVRALAPMSRVLELLNWTPSAMRGEQWRGACPVHESSAPRSRSFSVNVDKQTFQCFRCGCCGNQLDLFAAVTRLPLYQAALELCQRLGVEPPRRPAR